MKRAIFKLSTNKTFIVSIDNVSKNSSKQICTSIRTVTSSAQAKTKKLKSYEDIPGPPSTPFLGNVAGLKSPEHGHDPRYILESAKHLWPIHGDMWRLDIPGKHPIIWIFCPNILEEMLRLTGPTPNRSGFSGMLYRKIQDANDGTGPNSKGLLVSQGKEWQDLRRKVQKPMLTPQITWRYTPDLEIIANEFIEKFILQSRDPVTGQVPDDFLYSLYKWALESVSFLAFDTRLGCLDPNLADESDQIALIDAVSDIFQTSAKLEHTIPFWKLWPKVSPNYRKFSNAYDVYMRTAKKYINESLERSIRLQEQKGNEARQTTLLEQLAQKGSDEETAVVMALDMLFAGIDTSSHSIGFILYQLAKHPEVQEKLRNEILLHLPNDESKLELNSLDKMPYLTGVIKEGLRLHPPAIGTARVLEGPVELNGYYIEKQALYFGVNSVMQTSSRYVKDPMEFRPERWIRNHPLREDIHPFVFLPFGHGPRMCVGKRFAVQEIGVLLVKIIQRFNVGWGDSKELGNIVETLLKPDGPLRLRFHDLK